MFAVCIYLLQVKKLSALGYVPILFFAKKDKASGKWVSDVVTHLLPTEDNLKIVATMRKAYNFVLIKEGNSTTTLPDPHPQAQPDPHPQALPDPHPEALPDPHPQALLDPHPQALLDPHPQALLDPHPQALPDPHPQALLDPHPQAQPDPHPQALPDPHPEALPDPHPEAQEKETFYILDLHPVSLPVKEQPPPPQKRKCKLTVVLAHYV
ncbi:protein TsetseEP-like isoform X2 [Micropterus dolomieu]|uniref:protein TsetseEP-like isoform X2 n=1 Tax=Micropterus dolomieu TaxID=147949 RepID=UPI001E8E58C5|nr:protein TsetseEP-like isoform X2 [Micropterus dolomieu]